MASLAVRCVATPTSCRSAPGPRTVLQPLKVISRRRRTLTVKPDTNSREAMRCSRQSTPKQHLK